MKEVRFAQLAMAVDCEGTIGIYRSQAKRQRKRVNDLGPIFSYHVCIRIHNTDLRLLDWCKSKFKGNIHKGHSTWKDKHGKHKWKISNEWMICIGNEKGEKLLLAIKPYLILKGAQADTALEFIRLGSYSQCPADRERLWLRMKSLNKRGLTPTTNTPDTPLCAA